MSDSEKEMIEEGKKRIGFILEAFGRAREKAKENGFDFSRYDDLECPMWEDPKDYPCEGHEHSIKCPKCESDMWYSVSGYNGHIWLKCSDKDCISAMQ